jgi:hypothetical protein
VDGRWREKRGGGVLCCMLSGLVPALTFDLIDFESRKKSEEVEEGRRSREEGYR